MEISATDLRESLPFWDVLPGKNFRRIHRVSMRLECLSGLKQCLQAERICGHPSAQADPLPLPATAAAPPTPSASSAAKATDPTGRIVDMHGSETYTEVSRYGRSGNLQTRVSNESSCSGKNTSPVTAFTGT